MDLMTFTIEPHNIKAGIASNCKECPTALQLRERYPEATEIIVNYDHVMIDGDRYNSHDGSLTEFIDVFDADVDDIECDDMIAEHNEILDSWHKHGYPIELRREN